MKRHDDLIKILTARVAADRIRLLRGPMYYAVDLYGCLASELEYDDDKCVAIEASAAHGSAEWQEMDEDERVIWIIRNLCDFALNTSNGYGQIPGTVPELELNERVDSAHELVKEFLKDPKLPYIDTLFYRATFALYQFTSKVEACFDEATVMQPGMSADLFHLFLDFETAFITALEEWVALSGYINMAGVRNTDLDTFYFDVRQHQAMVEADLAGEAEEYPTFSEPRSSMDDRKEDES